MAKATSTGFAPSKTVTVIESGRVRDDTYDGPVKAAYEAKGTVFEATYKNEEIEDVRKGLARSALFLKVRLAGPEYKDNGDGTTTVYFSAHDKMPRNGSRKAADVETADAPADGDESA
jgi:hypothetical protein